MRQASKQPPFVQPAYQPPGSPRHDHSQDLLLGEKWTKRLRWFGALSFVALLTLATSSAHVRRQSVFGEPPQKLQHVLEYLGVSEAGHVRWARAVDNRARLRAALSNDSIHAIEVDVQHVHGLDVLASDVSTRSDLSFTTFLEMMMNSHQKKLVKLDFKDPSSVVPVLKQLQLYGEFGNIEQPFMLHADLLPSKDAPRVEFNPLDFLRLCDVMYPKGILSVGWATVSCAKAAQQNKKGGAPFAPYRPRVISQMMELLKDIGWKGDVTFSARACFVEASYDTLKKVLDQHSGYTLTVWNDDEPVSARELQFVKTNLTAHRTFVDLNDKGGRPILVYEEKAQSSNSTSNATIVGSPSSR